MLHVSEKILPKYKFSQLKVNVFSFYQLQLSNIIVACWGSHSSSSGSSSLGGGGQSVRIVMWQPWADSYSEQPSDQEEPTNKHTQSRTIKHHNQTTNHVWVTPQRQAKLMCNSVLCGHKPNPAPGLASPQGIF